MNALLDRLLQIYVPALRTKSSPTAPNYDDIAASIRTGDLLFYSDSKWLEENSSAAERARHHWAACMTSWIACLPCATFATVFFESGASTTCIDENDAQRVVLPREWLDWQHVLPIVCLTSKGRSPRSAQPCVYIKRANGEYGFKPLRDFMIKISGGRRTYFAVRHLVLWAEGEPGVDASERQLVSQRRAFLRDKITQSLIETNMRSTQHPAVNIPYEKFLSQALTALEPDAYLLPPPIVSKESRRTVAEQHINALARANSAYMTLYALYNAQIVRLKPRFIDAAQVLQQPSSALMHHLSTEYSYEDELLCFIAPSSTSKRGKQ